MNEDSLALIDKRFSEVQLKVMKFKQAPVDPVKRRAFIKQLVGDAEKYLQEELVFLRKIREKVHADYLR